MKETPAPVLRALEGLKESSGRTIIIAGPPLSGKSELLDEVERRLSGSHHRIVRLRGIYRQRETPYAGLAGLEESDGEGGDGGPAPDEEDGPEDEGTPEPEVPEEMPMSALAYMTSIAPSSTRGRGDRRRGTVMGQPFVTRARPAEFHDAQEYWGRLVQGWRERPGTPVVIVVEDGALMDAESREFLLFLSERARLRPLLLVIVLDTATPAYGVWEERLIGRGDVDWVKIARPKPDPREAHRLKEAFDPLPDRTKRVVGFTALMGGHVSEVSLSRVTRMTWRALADALLPATEAKLVKLDDAKVVIPHDAWIGLIPELLAPDVRSEMHHEIAEALAALSPEPSLVRRLELAEHFYQWYPGPMALRYLLETAELTEQLFAFDTASEVLDKALKCLPSLPAGDRPEAEAELRLFHARVLIADGRISEAERELGEGVVRALAEGIKGDRLEEWIERTLPNLRAAGPRSSLMTLLMELDERCNDSGALGTEVLIQSVISGYELDRLRPAKARAEAARAARLSREIPRAPIQGVALLAVALAHLDGTSEEMAMAEKFLRSAEARLGSSRRYDLQQFAEEVGVRLLDAKADRAAALRARERGVPLAQRMHGLPLELSHQLGIAAHLLEKSPDARVSAALKRARAITEILHLLPPAPGLLHLWLLEGRYEAQTNSPDAARDRWEALIDLPMSAVSPRVRGEALLRLAILEVTAGREAEARQHLARLQSPEFARALRPEWEEWLRQVRQRTGLDPPTTGGTAAAAS